RPRSWPSRRGTSTAPRCSRAPPPRGSSAPREPRALALAQPRQGGRREALPALPARLLRVQRGDPGDGLARRRQRLARRAELRDVVSVLRRPAGLAAAPRGRPLAPQRLVQAEPLHGGVGVLRDVLPHRVLLRGARAPL